MEKNLEHSLLIFEKNNFVKSNLKLKMQKTIMESRMSRFANVCFKKLNLEKENVFDKHILIF